MKIVNSNNSDGDDGNNNNNNEGGGNSSGGHNQCICACLHAHMLAQSLNKRASARAQASTRCTAQRVFVLYRAKHTRAHMEKEARIELDNFKVKRNWWGGRME